MPRIFFSVRALLTALAAGLIALPGRAQEAPPPAPDGTPETTAPVLADAPSRYPETLQQVADEIVWKLEQQGVLLIVGVDKIGPHSETILGPQGTPATQGPSGLPERTLGEGLRVSALESYFGVRAVSCGNGVTVLAPATMWVLNYENLPKPSAYSGLKAADNFRLLQASFTDAQWRQICGPQGLGLSDLSAEQRTLFLNAVPAGMRVQSNLREAPTLPSPSPDVAQPVIAEAVPDESGAGKEDVLTDAQRQGIRLRVTREMNWTFRQEGGGSIGVRGRSADIERSVVLPEQFDFNGERRAFGAELMREVAAYPKPGHLPFDWEALQAEVDLRDVKTVGDLVERVRKATGVELYCDPRYRRLKVWVRGDRAQAGSLFKAIARGVTGTWRRVENGFVLTDDLTGLAVRHTRIAEWIAQNMALASDVDRKIWQKVREERPAQYVQHEGDDKTRPSAALIARYKQLQEDRFKPRKAGDPPPAPDEGWLVSDLPPAVQDEVRSQIKGINVADYGLDQKLDPDRVSLDFRVAVRWEVPNIGLVTPPYSGMDLTAMSENMDAMQAQMLPMLQGTRHPIPALFKTRALVLQPGKDGANLKDLRAARRAGFTEVWMDVDPDQEGAVATLELAVASAREIGLGARAMVSALRVKTKGDKPAPGTDRNVLGETYTEALMRRLAWGAVPSGGFAGPFGALLFDVQTGFAAATRLERERGDWLDPVTPDVESGALRRLARAASIRGIDGIVLRDLAPPGYEHNSQVRYGRDAMAMPALQGGFSLARRLAFLKRYGCDPIDIGSTGSAFNAGTLGFRERSWTQLNLPLFSDLTEGGTEGGEGSKLVEDGKTALKAVYLPEAWGQMRQEDADKVLRRIEAKVRAEKRPLAVWYYRAPGGVGYSAEPATVESRDKTDLSKPVPSSASGPRADEPSSGFQPSKAARAGSTTLLCALNLDAMASEMGLDSAWALRLVSQFLFDPMMTQQAQIKGWDGLVIDLSHEAPGSVAALLDVIADPRPAADPKPAAPKPVRP